MISKPVLVTLSDTLKAAPGLALAVLVASPLVFASAQAQLNPGGTLYTVRAGDTLYGIAREIGTSAQAIANENRLGTGNVIYVGQQLSVTRSLALQGSGQPNTRTVQSQPLPLQSGQVSQEEGAFDPYSVAGRPPAIAAVPLPPLSGQGLQPPLPSLPPQSPFFTANPGAGDARVPPDGPKVMHVVRPGETLAIIAQRYGVPPRVIVDENRLGIPIRLFVDQAIFIPGVGAFANNALTGTGVVSGAASGAAPGLASGGTGAISGGYDYSRVNPTPLQPATPAAAIPSLAGSVVTGVTAATVTGVTPEPTAETTKAALPPKPKQKPARVAAAKPAAETSPKPAVVTAAKPEPVAPAVSAATPKTVAANEPSGNGTSGNAASSGKNLLSDPPPDRKTLFQWPVRGRVLSSFGTKADGRINDGINIGVAKGTPVKAGDDGLVAYAGSALKDFGNLVLIRHADGWVTAYAHASELKVKKGDTVKQGQVIALSGQSGKASKPQVHFEVRRGARPVDPLSYLARFN